MHAPSIVHTQNMEDANRAGEAEYRNHLSSARENASRDYDKALLTLASGALGISLVFVHDVAPHPRNTAWLGWSWAMFGLSLLCVVASLLTSQSALRHAIQAIDDEEADAYDTADQSRYASWTAGLNISAGATFLGGVAFLIVFAFHNLKGA